MKRIKYFLSFFLILFSLLLSGCSFILPGIGTSSESSTNSSSETTKIETFDFILDEHMIIEGESSEGYYHLTLYEGEQYQVKTNVDDLLNDEYKLVYSFDDETNDLFTITEDGKIKVSENIETIKAFAIDVDLYEIDSNTKVKNKYFILSVMKGEYANITLTNENSSYESTTSTYSFDIESGSSFNILYSVSYNTSYVLSFNLKNPSDSSFVNVNDKGHIITNKTNEDKVIEIVIKTIGSNGVLDEKILKINLKKSGDFREELKVYNKYDTSEINDGDSLTLFIEQEISFDVKFNGESKTNVISVKDSTILEIDGSTNTINPIKSGTTEVVFQFEEQQITITINVINDEVVSISAINGGSSFIIVNDNLYYLDKMCATYKSGNEKEISDNSLITTSISNKNDKYKTVTFKYQEKEVSYDVKYYVVDEYEGIRSSYDNNDFYNNSYYGKANVLSNKGIVKILVVPVWFEDSNVFFNVSQKEQIIEDIEYTIKGNRPNTELSSVKQYYEAQSYGNITMDITISDFYSSSTSYKDYTDRSGSSKANNDNILANNAVEWYFENNPTENYDDYDLNSDGYLDGLVLLYGANYYGTSSDNNQSYAFESTNYGDEEYVYNTFCFCPIGGLYGLAKDNPTTQLTSSDLSTTYARDFRSSSRVIIHEMGHMFGNDDLYEQNSTGEKYVPAGGYVMQDNNCGGHDPYHTNRIGWSNPNVYASSEYELGDKITIHLEDFQSSGQNIILTNKWNEANSLFDEYLILELFAPTGLNEFDSKVSYMNKIESGIRLWHANSLLEDYSNNGELTSEIVSGHSYELASSNYNSENMYDTLHLIRNNPNEEFNTTSATGINDILFEEGDSFDMETYKSQFINGNKFDNGDKLGWEFTVEEIYMKDDGTYGAIITLERVDNVQTEFSKSIQLNRSDLETPDGEENYSNEIFGENGEFTFIYKYVTPPSVYEQGYPISSDGMCLFASSDGNGGYIDLTIKEIDGKEVRIDSISITYSNLTNVSPTVLAEGSTVEGQRFETENNETYGFTYSVNSSSIRIQNQYNETINHWSVLPILEITINYTIK